ncbi:MAG: agmatinase [Deltaproteobacteria bacterium]|nr:agmatinase [Deltaproteobacteria bacterium]
MKKYAPKNPLLSPRFGDIATFGRLPHTQNLSGVDIAVVGIPFDGATTYRPGARFAPRAIRTSSCMNRNVHPEYGVHIYKKLSAIDYGDVNCNPLNLKKTFGEISKTYGLLLKADVLPIALGGDHSVIIPILRAMHQKYGHFGLIQFDAHTDTADQAWGEKIHHGTPIRRLLEDGTLRGRDVFQIGIRGPLTSEDQMEWDRKQGITHLTAEEYQKKGMAPVLRKLNRKIPYYLTFDVDGVDPAFAPGTGTPVVGGLSSLQALEAVRALKGLRFIGFDIVEVSPPYDHAELTTLLASTLVFEFMALAALNK